MTTRYTIHAYENQLDRLPGGPLEPEVREAQCFECEDSGLTDCGCMAFDGPLDECSSCSGDGAVFCGCEAGERRRAAWEAKAPDYYDRDYGVSDDDYDIAW